jgi:hypothetical protein
VEPKDWDNYIQDMFKSTNQKRYVRKGKTEVHILLENLTQTGSVFGEVSGGKKKKTHSPTSLAA